MHSKAYIRVWIICSFVNRHPQEAKGQVLVSSVIDHVYMEPTVVVPQTPSTAREPLHCTVLSEERSALFEVKHKVCGKTRNRTIFQVSSIGQLFLWLWVPSSMDGLVRLSGSLNEQHRPRENTAERGPEAGLRPCTTDCRTLIINNDRC